jgi:hypothetical protein
LARKLQQGIRKPAFVSVDLRVLLGCPGDSGVPQKLRRARDVRPNVTKSAEIRGQRNLRPPCRQAFRKSVGLLQASFESTKR